MTKPKHYHVVLLAATYKPFTPDTKLLQSLPEITAPGNFKDPVKIEEYIATATKRRDEELGDLWPHKELDCLAVHDYNCCETDSASKPDMLLTGLKSTSDEPLRKSALAHLKERIKEVHDNLENVQFLGVDVRDILRVLVRDYGYLGLAPIQYQMIADQRDVIDPMGLLDTGDVKKWLNPLYVLQRIGLDMPENYSPNQSIADDCRVAVQFYNRLCRNGSRPVITMP